MLEWVFIGIACVLLIGFISARLASRTSAMKYETRYRFENEELRRKAEQALEEAGIRVRKDKGELGDDREDLARRVTESTAAETEKDDERQGNVSSSRRELPRTKEELTPGEMESERAERDAKAAQLLRARAERAKIDMKARLGRAPQEERRQEREAESLVMQSQLSAMRHEAAMSVIRNINGGKSRVRFRAGAPRAMAPGSEASVRFVAYSPAEERHIVALLESVAEDAEARVERSETSWIVGTKARVRCYGDSLLVTPEAQEFTWEGRGTHLDFDVTVSAAAHVGTNTRIRFDVSVDGIVVARLRVGVEVVSPGSLKSARQVVGAESAKTAFASYASPDRSRVLDRVASVRTATGLDVWMDSVNLRPNDRWQDLLSPEIESRDLFFLFWSAEAARSHWVDWEWRTALEKKGLDAMQLHPLENLPGTLPPELGELHATDVLMDVREAASKKICPCGSGRPFDSCHGARSPLP